jgi:hypothetical protein
MGSAEKNLIKKLETSVNIKTYIQPWNDTFNGTVCAPV